MVHVAGESRQTSCACAQEFLDLMSVAPSKREWLRKTTCPACKKEYWANRETDYCFECESDRSTEARMA